MELKTQRENIDKAYTNLRYGNRTSPKYRKKRHQKIDDAIYQIFYPEQEPPASNELFKTQQKRYYGLIQFTNAILNIDRYILPLNQQSGTVNFATFNKTISILNYKYLYSNILALINGLMQHPKVIDSGYDQYLKSAKTYLTSDRLSYENEIVITETNYKAIINHMSTVLVQYHTSKHVKANITKLWRHYRKKPTNNH